VTDFTPPESGPVDVAAQRPWFDHKGDVKPRLDRFRDPWHWLIDSLPWFLRRLYLSARYREWVPNGARYILTRRPPWEAFDFGRKMLKADDPKVYVSPGLGGHHG